MPFATGSVPSNRRDLSEDERSRICSLYNEGTRLEDICKAVGLSRTPLKERLKRWGLTRGRTATMRALGESGALNKTGCRPEFLRAWTLASAWVWGLFFGDGWVRPGQIWIAGSQDVVDEVKRISGCTAKSLQGVGCLKLALGGMWAVKLVEEKFALLPGPKSHKIRWPLLPADCLRAFVRGLWDSDGSFWLQGNRKQYLYSGYGSCSREFVVALRDILGANAGVKNAVVEQQQHESYVIRYASEDSLKLGNWLYPAGGFYFGSKFKVFEQNSMQLFGKVG